ncbi:cytochrome c oxidase assembly protein [Microbispora sp. RL4-1S]|uniref:Cytochrome c oxidase assembly protein n=1 Tax=Microbispora oryzae TaxID=2806554 RepID=A0A940WID0_9ACTN|nr:cytochrome c oxidase assembly protein [Microbispora oryzae]MBP2706145.1 cytochrome c oxidase assembly protein [Microbispora oryzae]
MPGSLTHLHDGGPWAGTVPVAGVALLAAVYLLLARRAGYSVRRPRDRWRVAAFLTGCALLALALLPPIASSAHHDFRGHMLQHLLIGMYAPLALVLGAPITTLLRALPARRARRLTAVLRSRALEPLTHPITALCLTAGGLAVLYMTPLYDAATGRPIAHWLLDVHFLLSGCLFAWIIAGPDPAPHRPSVPYRLVVLGVAIAAHAVIAQLMYGGFLVDVHAPIAQVRGGAEIMYYGGDVAELLLAAALVATWRPVRRAAPARPRPQPAAGGS